MNLLKTTVAFDSAHFLSGYNGKCAQLHGHRWQMEVCVHSDSLITAGEKRGMVMDFSDLKKSVRALADYFDHTLIIENDSLKKKTMEALHEENFRIIEVPFRPTAENFAKYFYDCLRRDGLPVKTVTVYETPENCAVYEEDVCSR